ncbi:hypothetical protein EWB00_006173, partial [Schistosoma japonicum]
NCVAGFQPSRLLEMSNIFERDFIFKSNHSLDTQITASIDRGDFHLSLLSLISFISWTIYVLFYNSRVVGLIISTIARRFLKDCYMNVGSVSLSVLGGKLMLRDFVYVNDDFSVRMCYVIVVFNYWTRYYPERKDNFTKRCLHVYLYGVDIHLFNRTTVYNKLQYIFKPNYHESSELLCRSAVAFGVSKETSKLLASKNYGRNQADIPKEQVPCDSDSSSGALDIFWRHAHKLLPSVKFDFELANICAGNHLLPRACLLTCSRMYGSYSINDAPSRLDRYQHQIKSHFINLMGSLVPVSKYSGQHAVEDPPKSWNKAFHVFQFGDGTIDYIQDEPGLVLRRSEKLELTDDNMITLNTWPKWELHVLVKKICQLNYSPWTDRQRDIIWRFFFPPSYQIAKPNEPATVGQRRVAKKFVFELKTSTNINLDLYFMRHGVVESMRLSGFPDSIIKLSIPWIINQNGFVTTLKINLVKCSLVLDHLWRNILTSNQYVDLHLKMHYPREWNIQQLWDIGIDTRDTQLTILFDYKHYFKGFIDDWCRCFHPDLLGFIPCTYKFHVKSNNLDLILLANDYNWISKYGENAYLGFHVKKFMLTFDLPFIDFLPITVPIIYNVEGSSVSLRMSIPETSTLYYLVQEVHNRLKFVNGRGQVQKSSPFHSSIQEMTFHETVSKTISLRWFDCGWAPRISLKIAYVYHPSPWASEYWRFIPLEYKLEAPSTKGLANFPYRSSSNKLHASKRIDNLNLQTVESASQSDLEEIALRKLRPEGCHTQGPTENDILQSKCDVFASFEPDTVDVHLHIPSAQLLFYGTLLRHFIHVKENYFGCYQVPVSFDREPLRPDESSSLTDDDLIQLKKSRIKHSSEDGVDNDDLNKASNFPEKRIIDPRDYRPLSVRVSLEFHNIQVHLPMHGSSNESPCPTAFLDCIGFEMDKRWHETKLQLLFSPILICFYDHNKDFRSKSNSTVSSSRVQLLGFQLRGQGMFSHVNLPIRAESLEYAWLLEFTVGQFTGQLSASKLSCLVQCLKEFIFSAVDPENQLISSRAFELCQHGRPQQLCPFWHRICSTTLCPSDMQLKYRMLRLTIDCIDLSIVENRNCLSIQSDSIRLAHCNRHGATHCDGMFVLIPDVRLVQLVAPMTFDTKYQPGPDKQVTCAKQVENSVLWFEAGSFSLGPVHINLSKTPEKCDHLSWQLDFLKRHDLSTKRLSFLWTDNSDTNSGTLRNASLSSRHTTKSLNLSSTRETGKHIIRKPIPGYIAPDIMPNCGCYGQCSFFGQNESGRILFNELLTGDFRQRAIFPSRADYKPDLFLPSDHNDNNENPPASTSYSFTTNQQQISTSKSVDCCSKSLRFGESLLLVNCLLHELHSSHECQERYNGLLLMREEVISAHLEASIINGMDWYLQHFCEEDYQSDSDFSKSSDSLGTYASFDSNSNIEQLIQHESDVSAMNLCVKSTKEDPIIYDSSEEEKKRSKHYSIKKTTDSWPDINASQQTKHSSICDLLLPVAIDDLEESGQGNENKEFPETSSLHSTSKNIKSGTKKPSYLPSNLSLNSLIELPPQSCTSSSSSSNYIVHPANIDQPHVENVNFTSSDFKSPPTPPPRKFVTDCNIIAGGQNELLHTEDSTLDKIANTESKNLGVGVKDFDDTLENFVDLRTQLNRPISESGLLRPAYGRHLNSFKCISGLNSPTSLRNRWHICKHLHPGNTCLHSLDNLLRSDKSTCSSYLKSSLHQNITVFNLFRQCQPKIAIAPRFQIRHIGFSPQSIRPDLTPSRSAVPLNLSDFTQKESNYDVNSASATVKSKAIVWLQGPINLFLTPLLIESLERYIKVLIPIVKTTSPSSIVNSMHYKCVKSVEHQIKPFLSSHNLVRKIQSNGLNKIKPTHLSHPVVADKTSGNSAPIEESQSILHNLLGSRFAEDPISCGPSHRNHTAKSFRIRKSSADYELMSNSQDPIKFKKNTSTTSKPLYSVTELSDHRSQGNLTSDKLLTKPPVNSNGIMVHSCQSILSSKVAALSVERINILFLQLYAVEDLVHLDSLKSGLHDLTCVSLMTFCIDSFSFELMASYKRESLTENYHNANLINKHNSMSTPGSNISNRPYVASSTAESVHLSVHQPSTGNAHNNADLQENNISSSVHDIFGLSGRYNLISNNHYNEEVNNSFPFRIQHKRQPSAPPVLYNLSDLSNVYETFTQSSEPVLRKSKWQEILLNDFKANECQDKSKDIEDNSCMRPVASYALKNNNNTSRSMEYISSLSGLKTNKNTDDLINPIYVKPTEDETNYRINDSLDGEHRGNELVCQVTIRRIHGQLRRLTRSSQFNADVLLTAIPFESSRAFFSFDSDPCISNVGTTTNESLSWSKYFREQSFGWIMFECGLEGLSFSWVQRSGFPDSVSAIENTKTTSTDQQPKYIYDENTPSGHNPFPHDIITNSSTDKKVNHVNGLSSKLVVNTVWLNFAAPKRLPNKRRIELIRSDWNLLSTAAPTIRAWIDPCNRLVDVCKQFRLNSERRLLAVISCLMTEVVNPRSDILNSKNNKRCSYPVGNKVQLVMKNNDLDGFAQHRTETAHVLRFNPSCQLLVVLRRYLLTMSDYYGITKADELLSEMLKDSVVPQNEFLQRGILSLTREWRFLVDSLAVSASDLKTLREFTMSSVPLRADYSVDLYQNDFDEPGFSNVVIRNAGSLFNASHDCHINDTGSLQQTATGKPLTTTLPKTGNYLKTPSPAVTSRLLKMVVGSMSPTTPRPARAGIINVEDGLKPITNANSNQGLCKKQSDDMQYLIDKPVSVIHGQNTMNDDIYDQPDEVYWDATDQLDSGTVDTNDPLIHNPIMKRFLQDARANIMEHPLTPKVTPSVLQSTANITEPKHQHNTTETSFVNRLSSINNIDLQANENDNFSKTVSTDDTSKATSKKHITKEKQASDFDRLFNTADYKITTTDFEQAAHMNAQYRYVAYIQSLFSPLLESVGLSIKGIRRTTLMKKFDGFLSMDGLLKTFQIEIVSSTRNPVFHSLPKPLVSERTNESNIPRSTNRLFTQETCQRQFAFLCCNFASNLILRDIVGYSGATSKFHKQKSSHLNQMQTTTKIDVILHIDFIRQHVNLSLLRLVHQFVTIIYCARDTCKSVSCDQSVHPTIVSPTAIWSHKVDSKGSSDDTDGTFRSHSSAYVRFGDESVDIGLTNPGKASKGFNNNEEMFHSFTIDRDRSSGENSSNSSADKDLLIITNPVNLHDVVTTIPSFSPVPTNRISDYVESSMNAPRSPTNHSVTSSYSSPSCWRRLANYVELYSTVPKTKTVIRKPISTSLPSTTMPTITEEDRDRNIICTSESFDVKNNYSVSGHSKHHGPSSPFNLNSPTGNKGFLFGRKTFPTVTYRVLNEEMVNDHESLVPKDANSHNNKSIFTNPWNSNIQAFLSRPSTVEYGDKLQNIFKVLSSNDHSSKYPFCTLTNTSSSKQDNSPSTCCGVEQFTYPWVWGERIPLVVFVAAKIRQMAVSAVLSELNLNAGVRNVHGSFTLSKQIRGHGGFSEKFLTHSLNLHFSDYNIQLTEKLPSKIQEVVCVKAGRSHLMLSCSRSLQSERNACFISLGRIMVTLPHHPVRLHSVMQRQAKRISSTVYELLRNPNTGYTQIHSWRSSGSRMATTPTCSTTTTASDPSNNLRSSYQLLTEPAQFATTASKTNPSPPLSFNLLAVSQGLTVNVALHSTLKAVYHIDPIYVTGQVGSRSYVDISVTDHSLSLKSLHPPANFPTSISLPLPRILASIVQRVSSGGRYARSQRKAPTLTHGLEAEQGLYLDIQIQIDTLEQNLTTDMLNYIMVVVKLFMKEINEVIQKMAGEERPRLRKPHPKFTHNQMSQPDDLARSNVSTIQNVLTGDWLLSRAARGRGKFTIKIRMKEIQLLASTKNGAIKLEARKIEIELTNRVSQTHLLDNRNAASSFFQSNDPHDLSQKRPSNLNIRPNAFDQFFESGRKSSAGLTSDSSLFIYATIANVGLDLGYFDQDTFHALSPDFQNVAFFRTSIALRSLLADEKFAPTQGMNSSTAATVTTTNTSHCEQDAFLISLNRPIVWLKPFTLDRGIMMWMVYKDEFAKWNEHIEHLASMVPPEEAPIHSNFVHHSTGHPPEDYYTSLPSSVPFSSVHPIEGCANGIPDVAVVSNNRVNNKLPSTLFLQLSIEDLGVCLPIHMIKLPSQSLKSDSRTALVLTLDKSRISACYQDSLVSQGEFTDFCLRFDDEFNVGSDDWKPDKKRSTIDVKGKRYVVILNACVVPSGTFSVCWRDLEKRGQWHIGINWQMRGLDIHLDDSIGRRLKALFTILTRMTGYNDAAPLLPTSGEEEDGEGKSHSRDTLEIGLNQEIVSTGNEYQALPGSTGKRSSVVSSVSTKKPITEVDIASLDRYQHLIMSKEFNVKNILDNSQFRSMEFHKQKLNLSDAQAFKRQKWNTLRKKKSGHMTRVLRGHNSPRTGHCINDCNLADIQPLGSQSQKSTKTDLRLSTSVIEDFLPSRTQSNSHTMIIQGTNDVKLRRLSNVAGVSTSHITKIDSVYFDAEDTSPSEVVSKNISADNNNNVTVTDNGNTKSELSNLQTNSQIFDEYSDDWCDPYVSLDVDDDLYHDAGELSPIERDNTESLYTTHTNQTVGNNVVEQTKSNIKPPTPPPRKSRIFHDEHNNEFHPSVEQSTINPVNTQEEPKLQLELDLQIHVDSGCCVLHPRLPPKFMPDDNCGKQYSTSAFQTGIGISSFNISNNDKLLSPELRSQTPWAFSPTQIESGYRLSYSELLPGYLERYRYQLLQDFQIVSNDISVFYLPAVDINLHYNSMTELDFLPGNNVYSSSVIPSSLIDPPAFNSQTLSSYISLSKSPTQSRTGQNNMNKDDTIPRSIRKQADLYVSCFLQKLPNELIVQPSLLDFLEQAIENLPLIADCNSDIDSVSSDSGNEILFERFPVHAIVHLHVQPFTIRFLCLPTSRMQCLMVLPFLDAVFSTKRDDIDTVVNRAENSISRKLCCLTSLPSDNQLDNTSVALKMKPVVGDIVSAGGISITAILKEFRISIFHPYGESSTIRSETSSWGNARPCDSLTILVKDIQCHFSRTIESKVVQMNPNICVNESSSSSIHGIGETIISTHSADSFGLHRNLCISGIFDIGVAEFTCDTRRTIEILDIYKSWYRSSLARRLFLGDDELIETVNISTQYCDQDEMAEANPKQQQPSNTKSKGTVSNDNLEKEQDTLESLEFRLQNGAINFATETQNLLDRNKKHLTSKPPDVKEIHNCKKSNTSHTSTSNPFTPTNGENNHEAKTLTIRPSPDTSKLTTLVGERGASSSRNTSLRVASWNALTIFCVQLKKFDLNLYMGSAMGLTRLIVNQSFCEGHISVNSSGRKNTLLTAGLASSQFISEGGGVGGEFGLVDFVTQVLLDNDPLRDPQHCLAIQVGGFQIRIEYMNTNILLFRVNSLNVILYDEWRLKDVIRQLLDSTKNSKIVSTKQSDLCSPPVTNSEIDVVVGLPLVFIRISGEINWDQAQAAIVRSTTPDLIRSIHKVRDYFQEQVREGRLSLIGQAGRFSMFPMNAGQRRSSNHRGSICPSRLTKDKSDLKSGTFSDYQVDKLLQRHWQKIMYQAVTLLIQERLRVSSTKGKSLSIEMQSDLRNNPVLSGSFQLSGHSLGISCFAGSFRSAPDWAVFNIQHPTVCFETEAQREIPTSVEGVILDRSEQDGWINVRQVLSFELGSPPEFQPQMAYVLRVRRGKSQNLRDLPIATTEEWLEFCFRGADSTVAQFPVCFTHINSQETSLPVFNVLNSSKPAHDKLVPVNEDDVNFTDSCNYSRSNSKTNEISTNSKDVSKEERSNVTLRSNPLKPPNEGELLFILPSLSLRITTDQRQTMCQPTLSSLPSVMSVSSVSGESTSDSIVKSIDADQKRSPERRSKGRSLLRNKPLSKKDNSGEVNITPSFVPSVKVSFQTDFHGFIQLGLIDVPWLPSLISSYLDERLNDYEISNGANHNGNDICYGRVNIPLTTNVLSEDIASRLRALSITSSPMVQDARVYDIIHWSLSPECRWLLATNIGVPAFDRLLESIGFRKARVTIPKWLQRGVMDHLDNIACILLRGSLELSTDKTNEEAKYSEQTTKKLE